MSTLYENYIINDDDWWTIQGASWRAQSFTPSTAHTITSVKLKLFRSGSPGTMTVSIKAVDGSGHPTGADLASGTIDGNTLATDTAGTWYEITLGAGTNLSASTQYTIVCRAPSGDGSNYVRWRTDITSGAYGGGEVEASDDSGSSWATQTGNDAMFEDWGDPLATNYTVSASDAIPLAESLIKITSFKQSFSDVISMVETLVKRLDFRAVLSDIISLAESLSTGINNYFVNITETLSLNEIVSSVTKFKMSIIESLSLQESMNKIIKFSISLSDNLQLNEIFSTIGRIWTFLTKHTSSWTFKSKSSDSTWTYKNKSSNPTWTWRNKP